MPAEHVTIRGVPAWSHDEGHAAGTFLTFDALSLGGAPPHKLHVLVPRALAAAAPTIYMLDGDTAFWPGGVGRKSWDVAGTLSRLRGHVPDAIVVAVVPNDRDHAYTHVDWADGRRPFGGLEAHAAWLANDLVPFVDSAVAELGAPAATQPTRRVIVGSSHGALAAFWAATRHADVFGNAGCLSPSFFSGLDSFQRGPSRAPLHEAPLVTEVADLLADPARRPRLWIDWGMRRDGGEHNAVVEAWAARRGAEMLDLLVHRFGYREQVVDAGSAPDPRADLFSHVDAIGGHDEDAWRFRFGLLARAFLRSA